MKKLSVVFLIVLMATSVVFAQGAAETKVQASGPMKIGVIYVSPPGDMGYSYMHDQGTKAAEAYFGDKIEVIRMEGVPEDDRAAVAMEQLVDAGCKMVFANSYNYQEYMLQVAKENPDVYFEHCSGYLKNDNMSNYFGRMYQMRYLSGIIAGKMTANGKIGYVGAYNTPEVVRGINAFALGVRSVNPTAEVRVVWTNTWFDPSLERQGAVALLDSGCDIIAQHQDTTQPALAAIERGKYAVGYNADFRAIIGDDKVLVSPMWNWHNYMIPTIQSALDGTWKSQEYWGGLEDDMIKLSEISPLVPADVKQLVSKKLDEMAKGTFDVFWGELKDNTGAVKQKAGEKMADGDMLTMDWFVEGVVGKVK
ncbi:MAG: BMP family ABC transporter substrate-binding protein [Sphaerochaetaceae bacterium]|jgi:basic membrane protein A|nr:BMP family ABC transporter substrate-binding protein [Sphaerochaetaceae bacterium]NLO60616.1 BMP family ABC transporter substrate-binding protein [Spirochaetales bacterium]MDD2406020.1 BMP family ABC transporter substrate-binding protein [Sphaerochaetaceae bacterium]MDD3670488.1 BMP family ABC transporter substrate-binding protein [Sphaerochaetaceae bacterium]MDD4259274.1 BMP family ABC transporter substrate-binding protein [Sphaerochaetaceae bacterium]